MNRRAVLLLVPALLVGCTYYSMTGTALPEHLRTVAIPLVEDRAAGTVPDLDRALTDALIERFADRSRLRLETDDTAADLVVRATVQRYQIDPVAVTGQERAALNRLTVALAVIAEDRVQTRERVRRTFSSSADYDPAAGPAGEAEAAARVVERLADDVFTAASSDW